MYRPQCDVCALKIVITAIGVKAGLYLLRLIFQKFLLNELSPHPRCFAWDMH